MIEIKKDFPLKSRNTFGLDVNARFFVEASKADKISFSLNYASYYNLPIMVLGGGSNILFTKNYEGLIIHPLIQGIEITDDAQQSITVRVGAGITWDSLVEWSVSRGYGGLENLSFIPGDVGASPIQNIGAYGVEAKDSIVKVEGLNIITKKMIEFTNAECLFDYRYSIFKGELRHRVIITHVHFKLSKSPTLTTHYGNLDEEIEKLEEKSIKTVREAVINIRRRKLPDPAEIGNAGSFFKNPVVKASNFESIQSKFDKVPSYPAAENNVKIPAGWLIEQCGWKGKQIGNCGVHKDQALVIVNLGNATGKEILDLAHQIQKSVVDQFGIELEMEVNVV
ncbi:MAG: UDP-N-acetylmuramate dehydrogenase [Bacteroidales bacterium]|nr:MAG: UDP-N-acetylmuramate dehydrogenase [Bacteroidales bacterium]